LAANAGAATSAASYGVGADGGFEAQLPARHLQPLDEVSGAHEQHAPAVLDESQTERRRKMALAPAGGPKSRIFSVAYTGTGTLGLMETLALTCA
jgi:hypothetical protein